MEFCAVSIALAVFLGQVLLLCSFGQRLSSQCDLLATQLYESEWPDFISDEANAKILIIFMRALHGDNVIVVGKLFPLVLTTFASVSHLTNMKNVILS